MKILCDDKMGNKMLIIYDQLSFEYGIMDILDGAKGIKGIWIQCLGESVQYAITRKDEKDMPLGDYEDNKENL